MSPRSLSSLRAVDLKSLLRRIGAPTSGTKPILAAHLTTHLNIPRLSLSSARTRILSIDLGLRNLAFCVADVFIPVPSPAARTHSVEKVRQASSPYIDIVAWQRVVLAEATSTRAPTVDGTELKGANTFTPSHIAIIASKLVSETFLPYEPNVILLERQRFRSGGGSAVQEWTLRVNMLEQGIWACLESTRKHQKQWEHLDVYSVLPERVGSFWISTEPSTTTSKRLGKRKLEKKEKVDLLETWVGSLDSLKTSVVGVNGEQLTLSFTGDAEVTRNGFLERTRRMSAPAKQLRGDAQPITSTKRDDLADCLLQAAAWVRWEVNRRDIRVELG